MRRPRCDSGVGGEGSRPGDAAGDVAWDAAWDVAWDAARAGVWTAAVLRVMAGQG